MRIYYAHPLDIYGTPQEKRDVGTLSALGFEVVNPNAPEHDQGYKTGGMDYFVKLCVQCDGVAFRAFPDGRIPAGVQKEIATFAEAKKPVIELPAAISTRTLSVEATREYLTLLGQR